MKSTKTVAATALLALLLAACSGTPGTTTTGPTTETTVDGGRLMAPVSIEQVLTFDAENTPVFVKGTLYSDVNGVRLCEAIGESMPLSCLGAQIAITDLDQFPEFANLLVGDGEVKTSEGEVDVVGYYTNGTLRIDPSAAGADAS
jgi:hypothetical protein